MDKRSFLNFHNHRTSRLSQNRFCREYDYRYSVLPEVFGTLIRKGRVRQEDLRGLSDDKLDYIQAYAR